MGDDHVARTRALGNRRTQAPPHAGVQDHRRNRETRLSEQIVADDRLAAEQRVGGLRRLVGSDARIKQVARVRHDPHLAVGEPTGDGAACHAKRVANDVRSLGDQRHHVGAADRAPAKVRDRGLLALAAPLLGDILELREEIRLAAVVELHEDRG